MSKLFFGVACAGLISMINPVWAGTITGAFTPIAAGSNVDLTIDGKSDWIHWGLYSNNSVNRKSGVPIQISDFSMVALPGTSVLAYEYADNYNGYTWYDGWPAVEVTNTTTGVWAYQAFPLNPVATGFGFQISVPADTTPRTLQVFVGAFKARGQLKATLSDGGPPYSDISLENPSNGPGGVYTLNYRANLANQILTVQWTLYQRATMSNSADANITLQAAALTVSGANNPPFVLITHPTNETSVAWPATVTLEATAQDYDGSVSNVAFFEGTNLLSNSPWSPYTSSWSPGKGEFLLTATASDLSGATRSAPPVEVFVYGAGGSLAGSVAFPPAAVDLTAEGSNDWIHAGYSTNAFIDRKAGANQLELTALGTNTLERFTDNYTGYSWSDGTPATLATDTHTGVYITGLTNGFMITAPADLTPRTLRLYVGGYGVTGSFVSYLSDASAAPFIDHSTASQYGNDYAVYEVKYAAASEGKKLIAVFRAHDFFDQQYGNVTFQAATLSGGPVPPPPILISGMNIINGACVITFGTQVGQMYTVEYTDDPGASNWTPLETTFGTGSDVSVTNSPTLPNARFYRVARPGL